MQAAEDAVGCIDQEHGGQAEYQRIQILLGGVQDLPRSSHDRAERAAEDHQDGTDHHPDDEGQPHTVDSGFHPLPAAARAHQTSNLGGGPVGQEDAEAHGGQDHGRSDGKPRKGRVADVTDDARIDHDEEGLGDQLPESGDGQRGYRGIGGTALAFLVGLVPRLVLV